MDYGLSTMDYAGHSASPYAPSGPAMPKQGKNARKLLIYRYDGVIFGSPISALGSPFV
jgi:hypothetical protein